MNVAICDVSGISLYTIRYLYYRPSLTLPMFGYYYYAALLPRRGPHIASHSVCPSVCLSVCLPVCLSVRLSVRPSRYRYRVSRRAT